MSSERSLYNVLGLNPRKCEPQDVYQAYRKMAIRWHPDKEENRSRSGEARSRFSEIGEAYWTLIDPGRRAEYDRTGSAPGSEAWRGVGAYHEAQTLYGQVFGGVGLSEEGRAPEKDPAVVREVGVGLGELFTGTTKKLRVRRQVLNPRDPMAATVEEEKVVEIEVRAGWKAGTKITFERMGDEKPGRVAADLVFVVTEKKHERFERRGDNLLFRASVRLREALVGGEVRLKHLDERAVRVPFKGPIRPGHQQIVAGEGMPVAKTPGKRGDLIVEFDVVWPEEISEEAREKLSSIAF